jgi:hypothetical protein
VRLGARLTGAIGNGRSRHGRSPREGVSPPD